MKRTLAEWLSWQETLHLSEIDLGLERIRKVAKTLGILSPKFPIITVAGTNGKGSTVALLEAIAEPPLAPDVVILLIVIAPPP